MLVLNVMNKFINCLIVRLIVDVLEGMKHSITFTQSIKEVLMEMFTYIYAIFVRWMTRLRPAHRIDSG